MPDMIALRFRELSFLCFPGTNAVINEMFVMLVHFPTQHVANVDVAQESSVCTFLGRSYNTL